MKTFKLKNQVALAFTVMMVSFSGCFDPIEVDLNNTGFMSSGPGGGGPYGGWSGETFAAVGLTIDSAINIGRNSAVLTLSTIRPGLDSIFVFTDVAAVIQTLGPEGVVAQQSARTFKIRADTIDFRKVNTFRFQLKIDSLNAGTGYKIYPSRKYFRGYSIGAQTLASTYCVPKSGSCGYQVKTKE